MSVRTDLEGCPSRKCDVCKGPLAPFGYAPPPSAGISIPRPIWVCGDPACKDKAEARVTDLMAKKKGLIKRPSGGAGREKNQAQGSLF